MNPWGRPKLFSMAKWHKYIRTWLYVGAGLVFLMVIIGGITRLTGSGLSMSDWNLVMGSVPPTNEAEWHDTFEHYKQFPQYQKLNRGMALREFKFIFFWEYLHRMVGRLIGVVFFIPFLIFWIAGALTARNFKRMLVLLALGAGQGLMGWVMVKSGLVDVPYVSHFRLAAHFLLAVAIIGLCLWYARDFTDPPIRAKTPEIRRLKKWSIAVLVVFFVQILWGAFTAGLHAGFMYNTFPLMGGGWLPPGAWAMKPWVVNFFENPETVQWTHRVVGTLLLGMVFALWWGVRGTALDRITKIRASALLIVIVAQYSLGVLTLLFRVPVVLGVSHQAIAIVFWLIWLIYYHGLIKIESRMESAK